MGYKTRQLRAAEVQRDLRQAKVLRRRELIMAMTGMGIPWAEIAKKLHISCRTVQKDIEALGPSIGKLAEVMGEEMVTADDIHLKLTQMFDADLGDLYGEDGELLPVKEWPEVWRTGMVGEVRVEDKNVRSHDGVQGGESKSWDKSGKRVMVKVVDRTKIMELLGRLKVVDAYVKVGQDAGEIAGEVVEEIGRRIAAGRQRALGKEEPVVEIEVVNHVKKEGDPF